MEITGPPTWKNIINALNSGAHTYMADMEDSLSPTWENVLTAHKNMILTCSKKINFYDGEAEKMYKLKRQIPVSIFFWVWSLHKVEAHIDASG